MKAHREIERKYDVAADAQVPILEKLPKVASVEPQAEMALESVYFDTTDRVLTRAGVTLRRRTGGDDDGWHLKLRVGQDEREEIHHPIGRRGAETVPKALRSLVQVHARGRALKPLASVLNRRVVHRLLADDGTVLADFCDDNVTARLLHEDGSATASAWREWELELVEGPRKLLKAADELFLGAGVTPSRAGSKLARTVGEAGPGRSDLLAPSPTAKGPAGVVVLAYLRDHVEVLKAMDPRVRRDHPDAVHKMRVSTRRLRSALASFKRLLLEAEQSDDLRGELKWLAGVLGGARDAEVMRDRLTALAAEDVNAYSADEADSSDRDDLAGQFAAELGARYSAAHGEVLSVLDSQRYFRLLDALDALVDSPPWSSMAEERARKALPRLTRRDWRRVNKHAAAAERATTSQERDDELHEVRKAAKRLRYSCDALTPVFGAQAAGLGDAAKNLQEVLGEHQDSVVSQDLVRELAGHERFTGDAAFALGRLHLIEQGQAARARGHYDAAWRQLSAKRHRRWLKP